MGGRVAMAPPLEMPLDGFSSFTATGPVPLCSPAPTESNMPPIDEEEHWQPSLSERSHHSRPSGITAPASTPPNGPQQFSIHSSASLGAAPVGTLYAPYTP